jgi:hypothetical protein
MSRRAHDLLGSRLPGWPGSGRDSGPRARTPALRRASTCAAAASAPAPHCAPAETAPRLHLLLILLAVDRQHTGPRAPLDLILQTGPRRGCETSDRRSCAAGSAAPRPSASRGSCWPSDRARSTSLHPSWAAAPRRSAATPRVSSMRRCRKLLSSLSSTLKRGWWRLISSFSRISASFSVDVTMTSTSIEQAIEQAHEEAACRWWRRSTAAPAPAGWPPCRRRR